jgi:tetratricopeptide (TPR) repeat protein
MKRLLGFAGVTAAALAALLAVASPAAAATAGQQAPAFMLKDLAGKEHAIPGATEKQMTILYFFDAESRPSQEGLLSLSGIAKKHKEADIGVWALTRSPKEKVASFAKSAGVSFPMLLDTAEVDKLYGARQILPTVVVVGPGNKVLDSFQGGGKATESMLVRVAERTLQRRQTKLAKAISDEVIRKNPKNAKAKAVRGYAALRDNDTKTAEATFAEMAKGGEGELVGKEGLASVYARKKQPEKALALAREVQKKAPSRTFARVIEGDVLYAQNKKAEAEAAYKAAAQGGEGETFQEAAGLNKLGRFYSAGGDTKKARELYDKAVAIDPYFIEGTTNKGVTYEKEGQWDKALDQYRQALRIDGNDTFTAMLAKKAQEMIDIQKDAERQKRIDSAVKELSERYRGQQAKAAAKPAAESDEWTTRGAMVVSFVDIQEKGGLSDRDGFSSLMMSQLAENLNASGRCWVVERVVLDRLLTELNLGSSELADPETALKLGKVFAARLIGTGSLFYMPQGALLNLRMIDTETTAVARVITQQIDPQASLEQSLFQINREVLKTLVDKYPLRALVAKSDGGTSMINLGRRQGVVEGTRFDLVEDGETTVYKGKTLKAAPKVVGQVEVTRVEPDLAWVKAVSGRAPKVDDKLQERAAEVASK